MVLVSFGRWLLALIGTVTTLFGVAGWLRTDQASTFLVEVALLGVACYLTAFLVGIPGAFLLEHYAKQRPEETINPVAGTALAGLIVVIGVLVRLFVFADDLTDDFDTFATVSFSVLGLLILLATLLALYLVVVYDLDEPVVAPSDESE